jgi:hypothetical protein
VRAYISTVVELETVWTHLSCVHLQALINQICTIPNLLMKRVIIMKGFCDLINDISTSTMQFVEQQRIYLENFQKRMHLYWSTSSSVPIDNEQSITETRSSSNLY